MAVFKFGIQKSDKVIRQRKPDKGKAMQQAEKEEKTFETLDVELIDALERVLARGLGHYNNLAFIGYATQKGDLKTYLWLSLTVFAALYIVFPEGFIKDLFVGEHSRWVYLEIAFIAACALSLAIGVAVNVWALSWGRLFHPQERFAYDYTYLDPEDGDYSRDRRIKLLESKLDGLDRSLVKIGKVISCRARCMRIVNVAVSSALLLFVFAAIGKFFI